MRYFYTTKEPDLKAGMLTLGHRVTHEMIIPPRTSNYTIAGICDTGLIKSVSSGSNMKHQIVMHNHFLPLKYDDLLYYCLLIRS